MIYDDAYIEHWGEIYCTNRLVQRYCSFEQFLARPREYVEDIGHALLLEQLVVQRRIDAQHRNARSA